MDFVGWHQSLVNPANVIQFPQQADEVAFQMTTERLMTVEGMRYHMKHFYERIDNYFSPEEGWEGCYTQE